MQGLSTPPPAFCTFATFLVDWAPHVSHASSHMREVQDPQFTCRLWITTQRDFVFYRVWETFTNGSEGGSERKLYVLQCPGAWGARPGNIFRNGSGRKPHYLQAAGTRRPRSQTGSMPDPPHFLRLRPRIHADPGGGSAPKPHFS